MSIFEKKSAIPEPEKLSASPAVKRSGSFLKKISAHALGLILANTAACAPSHEDPSVQQALEHTEDGAGPVAAEPKPDPQEKKIHEAIVEKKEYTIGETKIVISRTRYGTGPIFFNMHDNENTSVESAEPFIKKIGGTLLQIENKNQRMITFTQHGKRFSFDPNRMFNAYGAAQTLAATTPGFKSLSVSQKKEAADAVLAFGTAIAADFKFTSSDILFALHNNGEGGTLSIDKLTGKSAAAREVSAVNKDRSQDRDDLFYVTDQQDFDALKRAGFNVALHNPDSNETNGSLIAYASMHGLRYINIEAQHGHDAEQAAMVAQVVRILNLDSRHPLDPDARVSSL